MNSQTDRQQKQERNAGLLLIAAAALAIVAGNGPFAGTYQGLLHLQLGPVLPRVGQMNLHHWIADGLMAVFFLLVGLEVKREWFDGQLSTPADRRLPILAAAAGMAVPALIYLAVVGNDAQLRNGWAIPAATDIAFAIGVMAILGRRVPASIKLLLVTIAIVDDIGAVIIIALFYTADLNVPALAAALAVTGALGALGQFGVRRLWPFMAGFMLLWMLMLASGVHATIAGVLTALAIPLGRGEAHSPLKRLEHRVHPWVMFGVVPLFGFSSAGVELVDGIGTIIQPLPLAIVAGLFFGKQVGIFGAIWVAEKLGIAARPGGAGWLQIYGASLLCGIGFTMSLFIGALAFPASPQLVDAAKIGILAGSLLSAIVGFLVLRFAPPSECRSQDSGDASELFGADEDR
ncbi:Na+/H+ antiporter NhaA [Sphingomonas sp. NSE70-1]|uniref:Na(+)/H(+) antiporter NhaA n=1 Tax=Sphingomonas caseinilyticus TaxID=2908205 RepID=A0ABT0RVT2_9SPHN|nr:Na+/H+ antiporter NhaA [Sphingomonas caseinilyticus]MCL6698999.1 Na+/H+ antiporter NhaA [Sphingomonas caseinilyticus]